MSDLAELLADLVVVAIPDLHQAACRGHADIVEGRTAQAVNGLYPRRSEPRPDAENLCD